MVPRKSVLGQIKSNGNTRLLRQGISTRSQNVKINNSNIKQPIINKDNRGKRKAEGSPLKDKTVKRSALGNITNAIGKQLGTQQQQPEPKKVVKKVATKTKARILTNENKVVTEKIFPKQDVAPVTKLKPVRVKIVKHDEEENKIINNNVKPIRPSLESEKSSEDSSLYMSALEESENSIKKSERVNNKADINEKNENEQNEIEKNEINAKLNIDDTTKDKVEIPFILTTKHLDPIPERILPEGVEWDFDIENWLDPFQVSQYAMDIFNYLKDRECLFPIGDYMEKQVCLSRWMRSLLVDWMVEVQESFELNHETLYLAVKLVDLYLTKVTVGTETLQLLGASSLFIASKYDERIPPMVEDFLYICDGAYTQRELIKMEISVLKVIDFDLGIPLSYRFLRRYARCGKVSMPTLTLARFILEYSLMDYSTIRFSDSKLAASALLLALQMKDLGGWTPTLEYYSGYKVDDLRNIVYVLNEGLHRKHKEALVTIRNKYSHKIFFEVAKLPLKDTLDI
ncbi:PREDICTED: G2/mitotic-specific cyclin-B3 [Polistes dominula]|uniref:G2/mitotic-specific cyclin-B3 n=1 Tax=Polistes dominula TaxID=743375 RepID=A0ABM1JG13_POLDO|nr:PREDICTED: G2/mitotic-specific cyclin-B3 [Polistes dominula]XP_015191400.1 PREDICTED: G2/mitotic-specific cyclin-B3 [Polistes dominula]XP_015191401.1 PREDICTED: G2/mitotic-specific cyclin-B3 [Polistes dominula]